MKVLLRDGEQIQKNDYIYFPEINDWHPCRTIMGLCFNDTMSPIFRVIKKEELKPPALILLIPDVDIVMPTDEFYKKSIWTKCEGDVNCGHFYTKFMLPIRRLIKQ